MKRYKAGEGSPLGHGCCHGAHVLDLGEKPGHDDPKLLCECIDMETAERIVKAMNYAYEDMEI